MSEPIITVIVPVYNEENYIDRCVGSISAQSYRRLQVILVDGGSTDGSGAKCDMWASKWNMGPNSNMGICEVIHTSNNGVSASRNLGLAHASGDLVTFLDGDDWLEPDALSRLYELMRTQDADMSGCDFISRYPEGTLETEKGAAEAVTDSDEVECLTPKEFISAHILNGAPHVWGRLYKRALIGSIRFRQNLTIGEDMIFLLEYVRGCGRIAHTSYRGYDYYRNPNGAMGRPFTDSAMDQVKCWEEARLLIAHEDEELANGSDLRANMLIAVMLTACRLAGLETSVRKDEKHRGYISELRAKLKEYKSRGAMKKLDRGYKFKVRSFRLCPSLFLAAYHRHKA